MPLIHYVQFENVKGFQGEHRVDLDHPAVLVGPNNSGKTTVLQCLALWSIAIRTWSERRRDSSAQRRSGAGMNRLGLTAVPLPNFRVLWHDARIRRGNDPLPLWVEVGLDVEGAPAAVRVELRYQSPDLIYVDVVRGTDDDELLSRAARLRVELLYPLSGLTADEPILQRGRIDLLLGQGETGQVLRNLCLEVAELEDGAEHWARVQARMRRFFGVDLGSPARNAVGGITLDYRQEGVREPLDLLMAGRGFLQMLLVLVYLEARPGSVLLIDEPDAHLEILRQRQIFVQLRDMAARAGSQVVVASHSEQILDEALDTSLSFLLDGRVEPLSSKQDIRNSLKHFGTQTYIRARDRGHVLYLEGGTDLDVLRALAERLDHPVLGVWDDRANVYFVQDNYPLQDEDSALDRVEGGYGTQPREHFFALRPLVPGLRGLALLDGDGVGRRDQDFGGLRVRYWQRYEIENYFITPSLLLSAVAGGAQLELGPPPAAVLEALIEERVFRDPADVEAWRTAAPAARAALWRFATHNVKLSALAEEFFRRLAEARRAAGLGGAMAYRKGDLHRLIDRVDPATLDPEVGAKLDALQALFAPSDG